MRAMLLAHLGQGDEVPTIRAHFGDISSDEDESGMGILCPLFEAGVLTRDTEMLNSLLHRLAPLAGHLYQETWVCVGRLCGEASVLLGLPDEARGHFAQALDVCEKVRFRPEIALIRLDLAELLLEHYPDEREAAIEHLDFAISEFREMKMQPSLERALRHRGLLKA